MELAQNDLPYQQAVEEARKDNKNQNWKNLPKGSFARALQDNWAQTSVITNDRGQSMMVINGERLVIPQTYVPKVLEMEDIAHVGSKKAIVFFFTVAPSKSGLDAALEGQHSATWDSITFS